MPDLYPCPDCGHQLSSHAKACPECGRPIKHTALATWLIAIIIIPGLIWWVLNLARNPISETAQNRRTAFDPYIPTVAITNVGAARTAERTDIHGELVNITSNRLSTVYVAFSLYDSSGAKIGDAYAHTTSVGPSERWKFQAEFPYPNGVKYQLASVVCCNVGRIHVK